MIAWRPDLERRHAANETAATHDPRLDHKAKQSLKVIAATTASTLAASLDRQTSDALSPGAKQVLWEALYAQQRDSFRLALLLQPTKPYSVTVGGELALAALGDQLVNAEIGEIPPIGLELRGMLARKHVHSLIGIPNLHTLNLVHCTCDEDAIRALRQALSNSLDDLVSLSLPKVIRAPTASINPPWPSSLLKLQSPVKPGQNWSRTPLSTRPVEDAHCRLLVNLTGTESCISDDVRPWRTYYRVTAESTAALTIPFGPEQGVLKVKTKASMAAPHSGGLASYLKRKYGVEKVNTTKRQDKPDEVEARVSKLPKIDLNDASSDRESEPCKVEPEDARNTKAEHAADDPLAGFDEMKTEDIKIETHALADPLAASPLATEAASLAVNDTEVCENTKPVAYKFENRFKIAPSKYWDGVDRSNGFELRYLEKHGRSTTI